MKTIPALWKKPTARRPVLGRGEFGCTLGLTAIFSIVYCAPVLAQIERGTVATHNRLSDTATADKPQSKTWYHDGSWWAVVTDGENLSLFQHGSGSWEKRLIVGEANVGRCDCFPAGDDLYALAFNGRRTVLYRLTYSEGQYQKSDGWETPVELALGSSSETATLVRDTTGRLWVSAEEGLSIALYHSLDDERTWTGPITIRDGVSDDDISVMTTLPDSRIGVMWSDQRRMEFGFATHVDGAPPEQWTLESVTADGPIADDHINIAMGSDGTLYAAVKTEYDTNGMTQLGLLRRTPDGVWSDVAPVTILSPTDTGTRPIAVLNEERGEVYVFYTNWADSPRTISVKTTRTDVLQFPLESLRIIEHSRGLNNVTSTRQRVDGQTGVMILATPPSGDFVEYAFIRDFRALSPVSSVSGWKVERE